MSARRGRLWDRLRWRRHWTISVFGKESGTEVTLDSMFRFRDQQAALARAARMNRNNPTSDLVEFRATRRRP